MAAISGRMARFLAQIQQQNKEMRKIEKEAQEAQQSEAPANIQQKRELHRDLPKGSTRSFSG